MRVGLRGLGVALAACVALEGEDLGDVLVGGVRPRRPLELHLLHDGVEQRLPPAPLRLRLRLRLAQRRGVPRVRGHELTQRHRAHATDRVLVAGEEAEEPRRVAQAYAHHGVVARVVGQLDLAWHARGACMVEAWYM